MAEVLAACSAMQYGRDAGAVEADRAALLERIEGLATTEGSGRANTDPENGRLPPASAGSVTTPGTEPAPRARNEGRPRSSSGATPPDSSGAAEPGASSSETDGESGAEREGGA